MVRRGEAVTLVQEVYERLRREVLTGDLRPGQRLQPAELGGRFSVSVGVMREALTRLAENHLVAVEPNQGFHVVDLSVEDLADLTRVRTTVEGLALRMSIERGDLQWQSDVLAAHYRLANTPRLVPGTSEVTNEAWADAHAEFHRTLIRACAVPTLIATCSSLSDATVLYQQWSAAPKSSRGRDGEAEHQAIVDAVLAGDADTAVARLCAHYEATKRMVTGFDSRLRATSGEPDGHRPRAAGVTGARRSGADAPR